MKKILTLTFLLVSILAYCKDPDGEKVLALGKHLYKLEKASWNSTDHFLASYPDKVDSIGGYLSYLGEDNFVYSIFFSRYNNDYILARYKFENTPTKAPILIDTENHISTENERILITIRQDALNRVSENSDNFFSFYQKTSLNLIPIIYENERNVYILTGPQENGYVLIGNDYKLTYSKKNKFIEKKKLHNSLISIPYSQNGQEIVTTMHSHVVSEIIDPTDICTFLLYKEFVTWKEHIVFGKEYVSIFNLEKETLVILTREAFEKMNKK